VHTLNFGDAEQELHSYLETHQDSSDALYMLGFVLNRENRPSESLVAYTQAAAITKPASDDLKIVGLDYVLLGDYADATKWLKEAVALDSNNADAWYYLGRAYYTKSRLNDARRAFEMILQLDATNARAENNLGLILETEGNATAALTAYRNSIAWQKSKPEKSEQPYVNLGNLLAEQGHPNEAIEPLEEALALAPNNSYCHLTLGILYRKLGKMQQARHELTRATELEPGNATAHYQLGRVYKDMHDLDRAKAEFDRTSELQGRASSPPSHINP
jgi:Flp pilus assembly protein TadD